MYPSRRLLYHRELDDSVGGYVTDYVVAAMCVMMGGHLLMKMYPKKEAPRSSGGACAGVAAGGCCEKRSFSTGAVVALLFGTAGLTLFGGLCHQFLQEVAEPYTSYRDSWTWLIMWRVALSFSSVLVYGFISLGMAILAEEGVLMLTGLKCRVFYFILGSLCTALFIFNFAWMAQGTKEVWNTTPGVAISALAALANFTMVCVTMCCRSCKKQEEPTAAVEMEPAAVEQGERGYLPNIQKEETEVVETESSPDKKAIRTDLILHILASLVYFLTFAVQFALGLSCGMEVAPDCPLPESFNHNAVAHVILAVACLLYFAAEMAAMKRRRRAAAAQS